MAEAFIVDAIRTPVGKRNGGLSKVHPADLGAHVLQQLVTRNGIDPLLVEDVVFGCVDTIGPQAVTSRAPAGSPRGCPTKSPGRRSIASAAPPSKPCTSRPRRS